MSNYVQYYEPLYHNGPLFHYTSGICARRWLALHKYVDVYKMFAVKIEIYLSQSALWARVMGKLYGFSYLSLGYGRLIEMFYYD